MGEEGGKLFRWDTILKIYQFILKPKNVGRQLFLVGRQVESRTMMILLFDSHTHKIYEKMGLARIRVINIPQKSFVA